MAKQTQSMDKAKMQPGAKARPGAKDQHGAEHQSVGGTAWEWIKSGLIGFMIFIVVRTFLLQTFTIVSGSMEGTLLVGDFLVLNKVAYGASVPGTAKRLPGYDTPGRGDIIVFRGHHEPIDLVKRLVGMPGDTISMRDGTLYVNGEPQDEPYARHTLRGADTTHPSMAWQLQHLVESDDDQPSRVSRDNWGPIEVPADQYFVLGDNRDESLDSRYWGFIRPEQVKGRAVALYFSYNAGSTGRIPFFSRVRWDRIGEVLR